jgi:Domain of unknown function (DUF4281)
MSFASTLNPLPLEALFAAANAIAFLTWISLIVLPRTPLMRRVVQWIIALIFCVPYTLLFQVYFFSVPDAGYGSLLAVQKLFASPELTLAGWLHYLAFDLFVGLWIAQRSDAIGLSRWIQAPILALTFMAGPIGFLLFFGIMWFQSRRNPAVDLNW